MSWLAPDLSLPALPLVFNLSAITRLFADHWPLSALAAGRDSAMPVRIQACELRDVHYQAATRCVATYGLRIAQGDAAPRQTMTPSAHSVMAPSAHSVIGVVEITPEGIRHRLFADDPQLPGLVYALNSAEMWSRFHSLLNLDAGSAHTGTCTITPIRYKAGSRCTLRYDLSTSAGRQVYFGKLIAQDGERLMVVGTTLYQASQRAPEMPRVARPLAYWPEAQMVVQPAIAGGSELHKGVFDFQVDEAIRKRWMHKTGVCLAALHNFSGLDGPRRTLMDDLDDLQEYCLSLAMVDPALARRFAMLVDQIVRLAQGLAEATPVASHGAFRTDQVMLQQGNPVFIDLDSFCWANPARDVGNLLAYLHWKALRQPQYAAFIEQAAQAFSTGYQQVRPSPDPHWLAFYQAASMLKIAGRRFRSLTYQEWPLVSELLDAVCTRIRHSTF